MIPEHSPLGSIRADWLGDDQMYRLVWFRLKGFYHPAAYYPHDMVEVSLSRGLDPPEGRWKLGAAVYNPGGVGKPETYLRYYDTGIEVACQSHESIYHAKETEGEDK